jgi:hypothetical protein
MAKRLLSHVQVLGTKKKKEEGEKVKKDRRRKRSSFVLSLYMKFP